MQTKKITLSTINDVKDFVRTVSNYDFDVDLVSGRYSIDGKSIMGIFSLDLSKPIEVRVHCEEGTPDCKVFLDQLDKFAV